MAFQHECMTLSGRDNTGAVCIDVPVGVCRDIAMHSIINSIYSMPRRYLNKVGSDNDLASNRPKSLSLRWHHNGCDGVSNHQPHHCLLNRLFRHRSKKISKLRVTGLCVWNSPETGEFPAQMASNAEKVSIRWRHHGELTTRILLQYAQALCNPLNPLQIYANRPYEKCWNYVTCLSESSF